MWPLVALLAAANVLFGVTKPSRLHPFLVLLAAIIAVGLTADMSLDFVLRSIGDGFATTFQGAGLSLIAGSILATFMHRSGAGQRLMAVLGGPFRRPMPAALVIGAAAGVGSSAETAFPLLAPLVRAINGAGPASGKIALVMLGLALLAAQTMMIPAPGPVIAANILTAHGPVLVLFGLVALLAAVGSVWLFLHLSRSITENPHVVSADIPVSQTETSSIFEAPAPWRTAILYVVLFLMLLTGPISQLPSEPLGAGHTRDLVSALAGPVAITLVMIALALVLLRSRPATGGVLGESGWVAAAIGDVAAILLITTAGGAFSRILQNAGLPDLAGEVLVDQPLGILLPFAVAASIKTAQGSSLVAIIGAAGFLETMLPGLGLGSSAGRAFAAVTLGAGAMVVSHANDPFFWIVTRTCGLSPAAGYRLQTLGTLIAGGAALGASLLLYVLIG